MNILLFLQDMTNEEMQAAIKTESMGWSTYLVPFVYWFVIIAAVITVVMSIMNMVKNPGALKSFFLGFLAITILFVLMWAISSGKVPDDMKDLVSPTQYKLIGGGLLTAGFLATVGLIILIYDLIRGVFKF